MFPNNKNLNQEDNLRRLHKYLADFAQTSQFQDIRLCVCLFIVVFLAGRNLFDHYILFILPLFLLTIFLLFTIFFYHYYLPLLFATIVYQ